MLLDRRTDLRIEPIAAATLRDGALVGVGPHDGAGEGNGVDIGHFDHAARVPRGVQRDPFEDAAVAVGVELLAPLRDQALIAVAVELREYGGDRGIGKRRVAGAQVGEPLARGGGLGRQRRLAGEPVVDDGRPQVAKYTNWGEVALHAVVAHIALADPGAGRRYRREDLGVVEGPRSQGSWRSGRGRGGGNTL